MPATAGAPVEGAPALVERAPAKVNLALAVRGRLANGYHDLESLVAFATFGDRLILVPDATPGLAVTGPFADVVGPDADNLVTRAMAALARRLSGTRLGHVTLVKRLPAAAGLGGGSADAAATLRLLARLNSLPVLHPAIVDAAAELGSDVPVCLESRARIMEGRGDLLGPPITGPALPAVLVNPRLACPTGPVFAALGLAPGDRRPVRAEGVPRDLSGSGLVHAVNDLEEPARALVPAVGRALALCGTLPGLRFARMSGSGATVVAVFATIQAATAAARALRTQEPGWWVCPTSLR